jgi:tripartite-type tricarboxylate transporter receptor subunit TctC
VFVPAGTPAAIIQKLNHEIVGLLNEPETAARIRREGAEPIGSTPEQFTARFRNEVTKWARVAKEAGLAAQ